ncbi:acyl-CoA dehydrogenase domain-containing protein [Mycolicibacterium rhodesiae JS60]|nr:acyl-CoA dehydrogenase domain-containing protein [Mycolicibacterium rhodesiae JS60]
MILTLSDEQQELAKAVRSLLERRLPESELRVLMATETGRDDGLWSALVQMGLLGLTVPEEFGGLGGGWSDVGVVLEQAGRALLCVPYFSTAVLATATLMASEDAALQGKWLPRIAAGECTATAALGPDSHRRTTSSGELQASAGEGDRWTLTGNLSHVIDGLTADLLLVSADTGTGTALFAVDGSASGLVKTPLPTLDLTRKLSDLRFANVEATRVSGVVSADEVVETVLDIASMGLAAEAIGGMAAVLDTAVEYAKTRYQFGRPIGSFQAIKHLCADMLVDLELAKSAVYHALWAADNSPADLPTASCLAKLTGCDAYFRLSGTNIQIHGGIGFTWEHSAHLHLKRAKSSQLAFGDSVVQRRRLADLIPIPTEVGPA